MDFKLCCGYFVFALCYLVNGFKKNNVKENCILEQKRSFITNREQNERQLRSGKCLLFLFFFLCMIYQHEYEIQLKTFIL